LLTTGCDLRYGFVESELKLSTESRLPKFVSATNDIKSNYQSVTITIYSNPLGNKAKVVVSSKYHRQKILYDEVGNFRWHPLTQNQFKKLNRYDVYPQYFIIKVKNIEETFVQKTKGDIIYVADEPK